MIVYYITAHGYGHGVRSCEVVSALRRRAPRKEVTAVTLLPDTFLAARLPADPRLHRRAGGFDVGMVQRDSVRVDVQGTLAALTALVDSWDDRVEEECRFLRAVGASVVVCDIPGIPLEAASRFGCPGLALGNFSWNWIYEPYAAGDPRWQPAVDRFAAAYASCDLLLRLPFSEPMEAFPVQERMPLSSEPGRVRREELAELTGADPGKRWVLLSFTSLDWDDAALDRVSSVEEVELFTVLPLGWDRPGFRSVSPEKVSFRDVLATCDAVVSKPGYGIVSECIVNRRPLIHAERTGFQEYPILVDAIEKHLPQVFLSEADLYEGRIGPALERLRVASDPGRTMERGGAEKAAGRILDHI